MWNLYDALIDPIPEKIRVVETFMGNHGGFAGLPLKDLARTAKS